VRSERFESRMPFLPTAASSDKDFGPDEEFGPEKADLSLANSGKAPG
jgi:hypothetical protein